MKKILVPIDFSENSENALNYAIQLASSHSSNLILLHVNQLPLSTPDFGIGAYSLIDAKKDSYEVLKTKAEEIKIRNPELKEIDYYSEMGDIISLIIEYSISKDVHMVVMGNSGHGSKLQKNIFGSNSVAVSKKIVVPLIIVPPHIKFRKIKKIAFACDYDSNIELSATLRKVNYLNTLFNSMLNILHVIPDNHLITKQEAIIDNYVEYKLTTTKHRTFIITENKVSEGIIDFINHHEIDIIIIEPKKHSLFHNLFYSSVTTELAFFSSVPVLTIHS